MESFLIAIQGMLQFLFLLGIIKYILLSNKYNILNIKYINIVTKWNNLVLRVNESNKSNNTNIPFTSKELKLIMKRCHPDKNSNDLDNKKLIQDSNNDTLEEVANNLKHKSDKENILPDEGIGVVAEI